MNFPRFIIYTFIGSLPWCYGLAYVGTKLGENWDTLGVFFHKFDLVIGALIVVGIVWFVRRHLRIKKIEQKIK